MIFLITMGVYIYALNDGLNEQQARAMGFGIIIWSNLFLVLTSVSHDKLFGRITSFIKTKTFLSVYLVVIVGLISLIYIPGLNEKFGFGAIPIWVFALTAGLGVIPLIFGELLKMLLPHVKATS